MTTATSKSTGFKIRQQNKRHGGGDALGHDAAALGGTWGTLHAGAPLRIAHWPGAPNGPGTIVLVHGRAEFIEVYEETIAWLVGRGFAVIAFDFRGQGGSRRRTRGTGHVVAFREYVDDLAAVVRHAGEIGLPRPFHILAHSMGGLVALLGAPTLSREVERMVLLAPLLGIERLPLPVPIIGLISGAARLGGLSQLAATRVPTGRQPFAGNRITSDAARYARLGELVERNPALATGAPTLGWLGATLGAIRRVRSTAGRPLPIPTLFVASGADTIVSTAAIDRFARSVSGGGLVIIPHARHQVLIERDELRAAAFAAISTFLLNAPRRLARVPTRGGRPLRFTPMLAAALAEPVPVAAEQVAPTGAVAEAAATGEAATGASAPVAADAATVITAAPERAAPVADAAAPAPVSSRRERRPERIRDRLRRRDDRGAARPPSNDASAPASSRREPRLDGTPPPPPAAADPGAPPEGARDEETAAQVVARTVGAIGIVQPKGPAPSPAAREPEPVGPLADGNDVPAAYEAPVAEPRSPDPLAADEPAPSIGPSPVGRSGEDTAAPQKPRAMRENIVEAARLDPPPDTALRSPAPAGAGSRYAPEPRRMAPGVPHAPTARGPGKGDVASVHAPEPRPVVRPAQPGRDDSTAAGRGLFGATSNREPTAAGAPYRGTVAAPADRATATSPGGDASPPGGAGDAVADPQGGVSLPSDGLAAGDGDTAAVAPVAGLSPPGSEPAPWHSADRGARATGADDEGERDDDPGRAVDRNRWTPPLPPRPVRGKDGRKR